MADSDPSASCTRLADLAWIATGLALAVVGIVPWLWSEGYRAFEKWWQMHVVGIPFESCPALLRIDHHLHVLVAIIATLWLARPLARRGRRWWAVPVMMLVVAIEECGQLLVNYRSFGLDDLVSGLIGVGLAAAVLAWRGRQRRTDEA